MRTSREKQLGLTMAGLVFILAFIALVVLFGVRAFPLYNEKMQVMSALNSAVSNADITSMSEREIRTSFLKNINATTNINRFSERNLKEHLGIVKAEGGGKDKVLRLHYQATSELYKELKLMLDVDHQIPLQGNASESSE